MNPAHDAERMVADVRDDPAARIRLAADTYTLGRSRRYRPYRRSVVAFMRWQHARGVLAPPNAEKAGSPWWRAVNEELLRDTLEAKLLVAGAAGAPSRPTVARWVDFFNAPSARSWYEAHNASVVAGYLAHADLAALEAPAERFFMNVVLGRVLYAQALVADGNLALGRFSFLAKIAGHPRARGPQVLLAMKDVLPDRYPLTDVSIGEILERESRLGRLLDFGVVSGRTDGLYASAARALAEPKLQSLVVDGVPAYVWPVEQRRVWTPARKRPLTASIEFLTRPRPRHGMVPARLAATA